MARCFQLTALRVMVGDGRIAFKCYFFSPVWFPCAHYAGDNEFLILILLLAIFPVILCFIKSLKNSYKVKYFMGELKRKYLFLQFQIISKVKNCKYPVFLYRRPS